MLDRQTHIDSLYYIIVGAKLCGTAQVDDAAATAKKMHITLDRALVMLNHSTEANLRIALDAYELVKGGKISTEQAVQAVICSRQNDFSLGEAFDMLGIVLDKPPPPPVQTNDLTEFMIEAEALTKDQLRNAIEKAQETGQQLARAIVFLRYASRRTVLESISVLKLIKDEKISREQGVDSLKSALAKRYSVWQVMFENSVYVESSGQSLKLGELLAMSQVVSESDLMDCFEKEFLQDIPLTKLLIDEKLLTPDLLEASLTLLDMVQSYLRPFQAAEALRQTKLKNVSVYQALAELDPPPQLPQKKLRVGDLLVDSGISKRDVVEQIVDEGERPVRIGKKLLQANVITEPVLYNLLRCQSLYKEGLLNADQTTTIFRTVVKTTLSVDEALAQKGLYVPARMQWSWT